MKKFILINCVPEDYDSECVEKTLRDKLYTEEEVKQEIKLIGYMSASSGWGPHGSLDFFECETEEEAREWFQENYHDICAFCQRERTFEDFMIPNYEKEFEVYELTDDGKIMFCPEYTTYRRPY